jgi:predicted PurR-regulated permease PerM
LAKLFDKEEHARLREIITQIKISINNYILGLIFEMFVVSILTGLGLWIIGAKYFILLGLMTGILNLIPYIGIMIAGILTIFVFTYRNSGCVHDYKYSCCKHYCTTH